MSGLNLIRFRIRRAITVRNYYASEPDLMIARLSCGHARTYMLDRQPNVGTTVACPTCQRERRDRGQS